MTPEEFLSDVKSSDNSGITPEQFLSDIPDIKPNLAGRASQFFQKPANVLPLALPITKTMQGIKQVPSAIAAADKNYPAENLLPAAGATIGSMLGGAATLPSGAGVPFGATIGATVGGQAGDAARQYVAALRGNQGVSTTPQEAVSGTIKTGALMGAGELGTSAVFKGLEALGVKQLARKGFSKLSDFLLNETKPVDNAIVRGAIDKYTGSPVADTGEVKNFVKDILDKRGISVSDNTPISSLTPVQIKNLSEGGLSPQDMKDLALAGIGLEGDVKNIASSMKPKLTSELQTPSISDYKGLGNIYQDLSNPDLTYGKLKQVQQAVGDLANFESPERTGIEKIYGKIYNKVGDLLDTTAEKHGFSDVHNFAQDNGRKFYQQRFLNNIIESSRKFPASGPEINYGSLATKLNQYGDEELQNIFGENTKYVKALRDLANENARVMKETVYSRISSSGRPMASIKIGNVLDKLNHPENADLILNRNLGPEVEQFHKDIVPFAPTVRQGVKTLTRNAIQNKDAMKEIFNK